MEIALERIANMHDGELDLSNLGLTELPQLVSEGTPSTLVSLGCSGNQLTELPQLPPTLKYLYCERNQLTELPQLPSTLVTLCCGHNQLTELPQLPPTLVHLYCMGSQLTELPQLPPTLKQLGCVDNQLQYPPADILGGSISYIRKWMSENPLIFVKSADKV
jgi:Leucine-rich repeat (LRR) protein